MHANPAFRKTPTEQNLDFARARGLGRLSVNGADGPVTAHVPFLLAANGTHADLHLARSNAIFAPRLPCRAVLAVSGPDAYISPDWYGVADQVPTWNDVAVHLRGELTPLPFEALEPHSNALSDDFEARLAPKPIWNTAKMTDGVMARMMRTILPFRLTTTGVDGTWKLSPNKTAVARLAVVVELSLQGGMAAAVAQLILDLPED